MSMHDRVVTPEVVCSLPTKRPTAAIYVLLVLSGVAFTNYLDRMALSVVLQPIKLEFHLSDTQMGLVTGFAFALFYSLMGLPLARIADRRSRVRLISVCLAVWSVMTALTGFARNFAELFALRTAVGVGEAGSTPASHSLIGDLFPGPRRSFGLAIFAAAGIVGQSAGIALAALIAQTWGWRIALIVVGLAGIPLTLLLVFTVREPPRTASHQPSGESILTTIRVLMARRPLVHIWIGLSGCSFIGSGAGQWFPAFLMRSHALSTGEVGLYFGTIGLVGAGLGTIGGGFAVARLAERDRRWELRWPVVTLACLPVVMVPSFWVADFKLCFVLLMVSACVASSSLPIALSAIQNYAESDRRATAVAIGFILASLIGAGLGPVMIGSVSDWFTPVFGTQGLRYALVLTGAVIPLWAATHFWFAARATWDGPQKNIVAHAHGGG